MSLGSAPLEVVGVHGELGPPVLGATHVLLHQLGCDTDHVLALPVLHHVEGLQRADDVIVCEAGHGTTEGKGGGEIQCVCVCVCV